MQCEQYQKWIMLLDAGELSVRRSRLARRHMTQCPVCRDFHNTMQSLRDVGLAQVPAPSAFTMQKVRQHIAAGTAAGVRHPQRRRQGFLKIAALLAILLAGAHIYLQWQRPAAPTDASAPSVIATPVLDDFSTLELLLTDRVVELQLFDDISDPRLTPLEMEIMLLEGRAI
ncbi:MAG: hypothetical protein ABR497_08045 [Kiritimatiellia bacterium]|nr:hypothetical protein [Lentisphaerota bacterium]